MLYPMTRRLLTLVAGLAIAGMTAHAAAKVGEPAPDFTLKDTTGVEHILAGLVHLHDAGVLELRGGLRLLLETHDVLRVVRHMAGQHLDGDHAPQGKLTGLEDGTSAPLAQLFEQLKTCDDRI